MAKKKKKLDLITLDTFYSSTFKSEYDARQTFTKDDLTMIVKWKITRGKFRPLLRFIVKLTEKEIEEANKALKTATKNRNDVESCIQSLTSLKGVGIATSSAILTALYPNDFVFMSDEALRVCSVERKYKMKEYLKFHQRIKETRDNLASHESDIQFTLMELEKAIWADQIGTD